MSILYPGTVDSFTSPSGTSTTDSPDHALQHTNHNLAIIALEQVIGTTAGTSILKNFTAGGFALNGVGGTLSNGIIGTPTITGGTATALTLGTPVINNAIVGSPTVTNGTINNATFGTPTLNSPVITLSSDATGDIFYRSSGGTVTRLAIGAASKFLTTDGTTPSWAFTNTADGWISVSDTWTYASASTVTVPSGAASLYKKGDRVKFTQTTVKYFVITGVADTVLTFAVNTDYVVANAAISAISYSHQANPIGFPEKFNFTSTITSGTGSLTTVDGSASYYYIIGSFCYLMVNILITTNGTGATDIRATFPVATTDMTQGGYGSSPSLIPLMVTFNTTTQLNIRKYDGTYPGADGRYLGATVIYKY